jgi:hypothetical protein
MPVTINCDVSIQREYLSFSMIRKDVVEEDPVIAALISEQEQFYENKPKPVSINSSAN